MSRSAITRLPELGAVPTHAGVRFSVWSTTASQVAVRLFDAAQKAIRTEPLDAMGAGIFERELREVQAGALYKFVLDDRELPDPYARFLPFGVHGPARVEARPVPAERGSFQIPPLAGMVIYELHIGTFTPQGSWSAAQGKLEQLCELGVNAIEVMPISAFAGERGWGYDGVAPFAPHAAYGEPEDLRAFIRAAHERGLAVILDAVYNHFGPSGNYLSAYSPRYFEADHKTDWGDAPAFREPHLRHLVLSSVRYWLEEIGFDGLRLDATNAIFDPLPKHVLTEIGRVAKGLTPPRFVIAEDDRNDPSLITEHGLDAIWVDDFHHALHVAITGERDGYYRLYKPGAATLAETISRGWLHEDSASSSRAARGGEARELQASHLIYYLQNHDQIGNRALGARVSTLAGVDGQCSAAMLLFFLPMVPMIFMGEEWAASTPFLYFTDHDKELGEAILRGRLADFSRFDVYSDPALHGRIPDPQSMETFEASRLRWEELEEPEHQSVFSLYRKMLALRRTDPVLRKSPRAAMSARADGELLIVERSWNGSTRTLLLNCGKDLRQAPRECAGSELVLTSGSPLISRQLPPRTAAVYATTQR